MVQQKKSAGPEIIMIVIETHLVPEGTERKRFSDYACEVIMSIPSRKGIKKAIKRGDFLIDGEKGETGTWINPGQKIELLADESSLPKEYELELEVVFEDEHIAAVIKPAGVPVNGNSFRTVENSLPRNIKRSGEPDALRWPRPVHRLDSPTSGLLLIAKTMNSQVSLGEQFEKKMIRKRYRAVVQGKIEKQGRVDLPVDGREALTDYSPVKYVPSLKNQWLTLVDLYPRTGRTHQLRRHMAWLDHPVVGDTTYGREGDVFRGKGLFLSAVELSFIHPATGDEMNIIIDEPEKFRTYLEREKRRWEKYRRPV
ncbi:MAG TPA: RluA family pseudouridine synthase [Spirochaetota bacterium]|nr:RluA family pseudouridine synthase [Spirochaetota bacterium]HPJ34138.1 RluA family pseudouridine synthase [Spirochaetota bacterium]